MADKKSRNLLSSNRLYVGKYSEYFIELEQGKIESLSDGKSDAKSKVYVQATEGGVYKAKPDGDLIPSMKDQKKCDYLIYAQNKPQLCFFELKGKEISKAFVQILDTINYLEREEDLKSIFKNQVELHAFIVSPCSQNIPKDMNSKERYLWRKLKGADHIHFVRVVPKAIYSDKQRKMICSDKSPILLPYIST